MLNLLPYSEKNFFEKEKRYKTVLILGLALLCALVCFDLILLSIKIYISGQNEAQGIILRQIEKQVESSRIRAVEDAVKAANKDMADISYFYKNKTDVSGLLEKISELLPQGVYITHFSFGASADLKPEISISGFSPSREKLFELKQALESQAEFKEVYFPASNWARPNNINFSLKFHL